MSILWLKSALNFLKLNFLHKSSIFYGILAYHKKKKNRPRAPGQTVVERNAPYRAGPLKRPTTDRLQVLLRPITYCHVLLRSPRFPTAY